MASQDDRSRESRDHFKKGLGHLWRAARETAAGIRQELDRKDLGKSVTAAGRELGRAMNDVVERLSAEITKTQGSGEAVRQAGSKDGWPKTREEYEKRYGPVPGGADWPKSPEEYEKRHGHKPGQKPKGPTPKDPGFTIMDGDDKPR